MFVNLTFGEILLILLIGLGVLLLGILFFTLAPFPVAGAEMGLISPQGWPGLLCLTPLAIFMAVLFAAAGIIGARKRKDGRRGQKRERQIMVASGGFFVGVVLLSIAAFLFF